MTFTIDKLKCLHATRSGRKVGGYICYKHVPTESFEIYVMIQNDVFKTLGKTFTIHKPNCLHATPTEWKAGVRFAINTRFLRNPRKLFCDTE
jgi:hypothetical protein